MDIAALALSILAVVLAGTSAWYTRSQAKWTKRGALESSKLNSIEAARHHEERRPQLEASIDDVNGDMAFLRLDVVLAWPRPNRLTPSLSASAHRKGFGLRPELWECPQALMG